MLIDHVPVFQSLLTGSYLSANLKTLTDERIRPAKWAATALLARVYLFKADYANAEKYSTDVIDDTALNKICGISNVFLRNNKEAIWQIRPTENG
jgi:starch-binding outer membrane protein, SusD/RagB family